jgi:hypothetical protein
MKAILPGLIVGLLVVTAGATGANEPAEMHLEFVRRLREKGLAHLALEHLESLRKNPPAGLAAILPMEIARTRISMARDKEPQLRMQLFDQARKELESFVAKNKSGPEVAQARLEIARLAGFQGQALLSQALRNDDPKTADDVARRAEKHFMQSAAELDKAAASLTSDKEKTDARFEQARAILDQAQTYLDTSSSTANRKRAELIDSARKVLEAVENEALKDERDPTLHLSRAWLIRCYQEGQNPGKAAAYYKGVMKYTFEEAQPGQRWARYFVIQNIPKDVTVKKTGLDKLRFMQKECLNWLLAYPKHHSSLEGYGVRFELAQSYYLEAEALNNDAEALLGQARKLTDEADEIKKSDPKNVKKVQELTSTAAKLRTKADNVKKQAAPPFDAAKKYFSDLAGTDSDYADKASQIVLNINFKRMGATTPVAQLKDFEECYLKARYEMFKMQEVATKLGKAAGADERDKLDKQRKGHVQTIIEAFRRALNLANDSTPAQKQEEARYYLAYTHLLAGDPYRAAVVGDHLARAEPPTKRSAAGALYALEAYAMVVARQDVPGNRERLRDLATFVLTKNQPAWKSEPVTQIARYQLAMVALREKKYAEAIDNLGQLSADFHAYTFAQCQLALTALKAKEEAANDKDRDDFEQKAVAALRRIPKLPPGADSATAQMFFYAQVQYGNLMYTSAFDLVRQGDYKSAAGKYVELDTFAAQLKQQFEKLDVKLDGEPGDNLRQGLDVLQKVARLGKAQTEYHLGNYAKVLEPKYAGEIIDQVKKLAKGDQPIRLKEYKVTGDILALALRAKVQQGKVNDAKEILSLLRRLTSDQAETASAVAVLQTLVQELKTQVQDLRQRGDAEKLKETVQNFSAFLDELAKEPDKQGHKEHLLFLASCYASMEKHAEAAKLYAQLPEPKFDLKKKLDEKEEKELQSYWLTRLAYARSLRLASDLAESKKVLDSILNDPKSAGKFLAEKEQIHLLEDHKVFGTAITRWSQFLQHPALQKGVTDTSRGAGEQRRMKELYFECFYHYTYCNYMYGKNHKLEAKKKEYIRKAADLMLRLENAKNREGWEISEGRYRELMRNEPPLEAQYLELKKK